MMRLWELSGAVRFLKAIGRSLNDGVSVIVRFPGTMPLGFQDAIIKDVQGLNFVRFKCTSSPFEGLCKKYAPSVLSNTGDLHGLCEHEGFRGKLIWLDSVHPKVWQQWQEFLTKYAQVNRAMSSLGRTLFVVPLEGKPPEEPPKNDVTMETHDWSDVLDEMDLLFWANDRLLQKGMNYSQRILLATTVAYIASWDFDIAMRLLDERPHVILSPCEMLRSVAKEKGWTLHTPLDWQLGTASKSGIEHAALASLEEPPRTLQIRLWSAQAAVLLPQIESQRVKIVRNNMSKFQRALQYKDPLDVELSELERSVWSRTYCKVHNNVKYLLNARNNLAHLRPLEPKKALKLVQFNYSIPR